MGAVVGTSFAGTPSLVRVQKYGFDTSHESAIRRSRAQFVASGVTLFLCDIVFSRLGATASNYGWLGQFRGPDSPLGNGDSPRYP